MTRLEAIGMLHGTLQKPAVYYAPRVDQLLIVHEIFTYTRPAADAGDRAYAWGLVQDGTGLKLWPFYACESLRYVGDLIGE